MKLRYFFDENLPSTATDTTQVISTVAALSRRGVPVELVIPQLPSRPPITREALAGYYEVPIDFALNVIDSGLTRPRFLQKLDHSLRAAHERSPDDTIIYTRNLPSLWAALAAGHRVAYEHYRPWPDQYPPLIPLLRAAMLHPRCLAVVLHSAHAVRSFHAIGIPDERLAVVHNGYDPGVLAVSRSPAEARQELGLDPERSTVVYAGRINEKKGLEVVLAMAERLPEVRFLLVGSEGDGPIERAAKKLTNVFIYPWMKTAETAIYLQAADVLVVPPSADPLQRHGSTVLPMKLFMYMAAGRPILAPRARDTREVLVHDENAVLVPPGEVEEATSALQNLLANPQRLARLGSRNAELGRERTWDARAEKLKKLLEARLAADPTKEQALPIDRGHLLRQSLRFFSGGLLSRH